MEVLTCFRPQNINKVYLMKDHLHHGADRKHNFQTRHDRFPAGYLINKKTIAKQFAKLHYLACHAPKPIALKWRSAYNVFMIKHFADKGKASMRFLNNHTCNSWL